MKTARLNIVIEPEEKEIAERLAAEYGRRTGIETTLSSYIRLLIRQAAGKKKLTALPPPRPKRQRPRPSAQLAIYREQIRAIALRHNVTNVRVFGSTARGEDKPGSDLDLLVTATDTTSFDDLYEMETKIKELIKVPVDILLDRNIPKQYQNEIFKEAIAL